jgi:hypothetical protein
MLNPRYHCAACGWEGSPVVAHDLCGWQFPESPRSYWACPACGHEVQAMVTNEEEARRRRDEKRRDQRRVHRITPHPVDFPYTRQDLEALFQHAREHDVARGGRYDARSAAIHLYPHHRGHDATKDASETIGTFYVDWTPTPRLYEIVTDEGFTLDDLMRELGRLERHALGAVKHGQMPPAEGGRSADTPGEVEISAEHMEDAWRRLEQVPVVMCGRAYPRHVPDEIEACTLFVAIGNQAFFADPGRMNEVAVAVYSGKPILLCLEPGVVPSPRFLHMTRGQPLRTLTVDPQRQQPSLEARIAHAYEAWVREEPEVHRTPPRREEPDEA